MRDKEATRQRILEEGKKAFMEKGYEGAFLRDIAKDAGVTTGAFYGHYKDKDALFVDLVQPAIDGLKESLKGFQGEYSAIDNDRLKKKPETLTPHDAAVDYIYDHLDVFLLLINCAHETSMKNWFDDFVSVEVEAAKKIQNKWKAVGILREDIDSDFMSIVSASYFQNIFEAVGRGMTREKAKEFVNLLSVYYTGGWKALAENQRK